MHASVSHDIRNILCFGDRKKGCFENSSIQIYYYSERLINYQVFKIHTPEKGHLGLLTWYFLNISSELKYI